PSMRETLALDADRKLGRALRIKSTCRGRTSPYRISPIKANDADTQEHCPPRTVARSVDDRALRRRRHMPGILGQHAIAVARLRRLPLLAAGGELLRRHVELDQVLVAVEG